MVFNDVSRTCIVQLWTLDWDIRSINLARTYNVFCIRAGVPANIRQKRLKKIDLSA